MSEQQGRADEQGAERDRLRCGRQYPELVRSEDRMPHGPAQRVRHTDTEAEQGEKVVKRTPIAHVLCRFEIPRIVEAAYLGSEHDAKSQRRECNRQERQEATAIER